MERLALKYLKEGIFFLYNLKLISQKRIVIIKLEYVRGAKIQVVNGVLVSSCSVNSIGVYNFKWAP